MWDCNGNPSSQDWTIEANGTVSINGECMDITGASTANGALVELWTCNGGANQQWQAVNGDAGQPGIRQVPRRPGVQTPPKAPSWTSAPVVTARISSGGCPDRSRSLRVRFRVRGRRSAFDEDG